MSVSLQDVSYIITMVGLITGGLWAAWTFHKLQRTRAAELANNQALATTQKLHIEQEEIRVQLLRQQPQLAIQLNVTEKASLTEASNGFLCVTVILKNEGEQNLEATFDDKTLTVGRIVFETNDRQTITDLYRARHWRITDSNEPQLVPSRIFRVGQTRQIAFGVPISEPGGYLIEFHTVYNMIPFEGEKRSPKALLLIDAFEQTIYFVTGKSNESAIVVS